MDTILLLEIPRLNICHLSFWKDKCLQQRYDNIIRQAKNIMTTTNRSSYIGANKIYVGLVLLLWDVCFALQGGSSLITNTKWKLSLDVGLQPGTWMPKRYPGWAESGARLGLDVAVEFTETPFTSSEPLVGEKESTFQLKVCSTESVFVSERGQQSVTFLDGGWCIQRPTNDVRNAGGTLVKPEGLLKFWLDCPTGAKKKDVEIRPNTRIFFTTGLFSSFFFLLSFMMYSISLCIFLY